MAKKQNSSSASISAARKSKRGSSAMPSSSEVIHSDRCRVPMAARYTPEKDGLKSVFARHRRADAGILACARPQRRLASPSPDGSNSNRGVVVNATNLAVLESNYPLARKVGTHYRKPTRLANDGNAASLAEFTWGAGRGAKNIFYVTLGTGIGAGMVLNGALFAGATGAAGEGGHVTIDANGPKCGCGKRGCIEMYASGTAVARQARERIAENPVAGARMFAMAGRSLDLVTAEIVSEAASGNDVLANDILHHAADALAIWLGGIVDLLEPEVIVIGGGFGRVMMRLRFADARQAQELGDQSRIAAASKFVNAHFALAVRAGWRRSRWLACLHNEVVFK